MKIVLAALCLLVLLPSAPLAAEATEIDTLVVVGRTCGVAVADVGLGPAAVEEALAGAGLRLIRKGWFLGGDVFADGLKRGALAVTLDGERQYHACPNRMDAPLGRWNPLDVSRVLVDRRGTALAAGLGGEIAFTRRAPGETPGGAAYLEGGFLSAEEFDAGAAYERDGWRLSARSFRGEAWEDADGRTFDELYGYADAKASTHHEGALGWDAGDVLVHASGAFSREVLHPYLLMDERESDHWSASGAWRGWRLYFNRTAHLMDNELRTSAAASVMTTDATNTVIGVVGPDVELWARHWAADNLITPQANPAMAISNHMLPDVWRWGVTWARGFRLGDVAELDVKAGLMLTRAGDEERLELHRVLEPDAERDVWSIPLAVGLTRRGDLGRGVTGSVLLEAAVDAPTVEELFIGVRKPGGKPTWVGNPELDDPRRATLRLGAGRGAWTATGFCSYVADLPTLVKTTHDTAPYQTWAGRDMLFTGVELAARGAHHDAALSWQWGEDREDGSPAAEIPPLLLDVSAISPAWRGFAGVLRWRHAWRQSRVDDDQGETATPSWDRLDLSLSRTLGRSTLTLSCENLTDELYARHLSYQRGPFSAGDRVAEPGRVLRVRLETRF